MKQLSTTNFNRRLKSVGQGIPESFKAAMLVKALMLYVANIISTFFKGKKNKFIKQGCIILIISHSKDMFDAKTDLYFK